MILKYKDTFPVISDNCFVAPNASIIGDCRIGNNSSIWFNTVLRGDDNSILIGENTNIQDGSVIHAAHDNKTIIGNNVTIGHGAIVHACKIEDNCLIGMGSTILDGVIIEKNVIIGANSLVTSGKKIPSGSLVIGSPARIMRQLTAEEVDSIKKSAFEYVELMKSYINAK